MTNCILTVWVPTAVENSGGFQRWALPAFWILVSNRGEEQPCWHRVSKGKQCCPWQGHPKGTEFPLAHDFPAGKSSVCTFVEQMSAGNVAHRSICATLPAFLRDRLPYKHKHYITALQQEKQRNRQQRRRRILRPVLDEEQEDEEHQQVPGVHVFREQVL